MEAGNHIEEVEVSNTAASASNEPTTADTQGGDIANPQQQRNDPPRLYIPDSSDIDASTVGANVQSAFSPDSSDEEDGLGQSNVGDGVTFHETLPDATCERINYEASRGYLYEDRPWRAIEASADGISNVRVERSQPRRPTRIEFQEMVEDSESPNLRPDSRLEYRYEPSHGEVEGADDTTSPCAGQSSDAAETSSDPPGIVEGSPSPAIEHPSLAAEYPPPSPLSPNGTLDFEKLSLLTKGTAWDDEDSDELFDEAVRLAKSPTEDSDGQGNSAPPTANAADPALEQLDVEDNSLTRVPSHMRLTDLSQEVPATEEGNNNDSPLDVGGATRLPVSPVELGSDPATDRNHDPNDDAPPSPVSPLNQSTLFSDFDQGLEQHSNFGHPSQYLSDARSWLEYESRRCLKDACIETRHQLRSANKECQDLTRRLARQVDEMKEVAKLAEEAKRDLNDQLKQLESDLEDRDILVGTHIHELSLMTQERDRWRDCADYRKPAWLAAQRKKEDAEARAKRLEQGQEVKDQGNAGTQTDMQYRNATTQTADPALEIRARGDANHGVRLRRRGSMRWPPSIRPALEEHIATWVNDVHKLETGKEARIALDHERVATILGAGFTPFEDIISILHADGYVFRDDRFAQNLEDWLWDRDSLVDRTEVMYASRRYSERSTLAEQVHSALSEISEMRMQVHESRRGGPMSKVELSEVEEARLMSQCLVNQFEDANAENDSLRAQLAASEEVVRELGDALASMPDINTVENSQSELRKCREHGHSLEARISALQDNEKALEQELVGLRIELKKLCLRCPEKDEEIERPLKLLETRPVQDSTCSQCSDTQNIVSKHAHEIQRLRKLLYQVAEYSNLEREYVPQTPESPISKSQARLCDAQIQHGVRQAIIASLATERQSVPPDQGDPVSPFLRRRARNIEVERKRRQGSKELMLKAYQRITGEKVYRYIPLEQRQLPLIASV